MTKIKVDAEANEEYLRHINNPENNELLDRLLNDVGYGTYGKALAAKFGGNPRDYWPYLQACALEQLTAVQSSTELAELSSLANLRIGIDRIAEYNNGTSFNNKENDNHAQSN